MLSAGTEGGAGVAARASSARGAEAALDRCMAPSYRRLWQQNSPIDGHGDNCAGVRVTVSIEQLRTFTTKALVQRELMRNAPCAGHGQSWRRAAVRDGG